MATINNRMSIKKLFGSLKARLFFSMLLLTVIVLPFLAVALSQAFEEHIKVAIKKELTAHSYSILAVAEPSGGELFLPEELLENQFNVIDSGLYALITVIESDTSAGKSNVLHHLPMSQPILWRSASALSIELPPLTTALPAIGQLTYSEQLIDDVPHFILAYSVSFADENDLPITLFVIKDKTEFNQTVNRFNEQIILWLAVIFILLLAVQLIWLYWTLKPLAYFRTELELIKQGHSVQIKGTYPQELQQVTEQLNLLLHTEQNQRVRYRNALADLAHSLKTPLAVMQSKVGVTSDVQSEITQINKTIEHQLKRAQSAGESSWRLGCDIKEIVDDLFMALNKIYQSKTLTLNAKVPANALFKGDKADLTELLGNLLDNACKAASAQVDLTVTIDEHELMIVVSDDGQGMSEAQTQEALERGGRVDTYEQGHGIGLAIVKDLVTSYSGNIDISRSQSLGGAQFTLTFHHG